MTAPSAPPRKRRTGAIITLIIGATLAIAGPIFGVLAGSFATIPSALETADHMAEVSPTGAITLNAGESVYLLAPVTELEHVDHEVCTASGPDGEAETVAFAPASALNTLVNGTRYESFAQITATSAGSLSITCQTDDFPVITAPPFTLEGLFGPLAWGSIGGVAVSLIGVALVIIGIVRLARSPRTGVTVTSY